MHISPLSAENVALLQRVSQMVQNEPQRFACAGRFLDDRYSKTTYLARLENELTTAIGDFPSDHPWRVSCQEKYNRESLSSPRARCEAAINDLLHRFKCDHFFRRDLNPTEAASVILLTAIGDCPEIQPTESACEFQRLPWQWDAEVDGHLYQGRLVIRARIHSGDWLELVSIAVRATIALEQRGGKHHADSTIEQPKVSADSGGKTQTQLAARLSVSESTIRNWSKRSNVTARESHGDEYTQGEIDRIIEWGAEHGAERTSRESRRIVEGKAAR